MNANEIEAKKRWDELREKFKEEREIPEWEKVIIKHG